MEYGEAIYQLTNFEGTYETPSLEAVELAIAALEKQIPKKPINADYDYELFDCPSCGTKIYADNSIEDFRYCLTCGQAIDWNE